MPNVRGGTPGKTGRGHDPSPHIEGGEKKMQETVNIAVQFINGVGFPIACSVALFYTQIKERKSHKEEMATLATAIDNNTTVLTKLLSKVDLLKGESDEKV